MSGFVVLLSAGLDSAVNLKAALDRGPVRAALTFNYGQRAARREAECAQAMCRRFGISHKTIPLKWLGSITQTALVNKTRVVPEPKSDELDDLKASQKSADRVWTPNRNGVFLAVAAAYAESLHAETVVPGFNAEEAATFPDNSAEFVKAYNHALHFSTRGCVKVKCFTARKHKAAIVRLGLRIGAPLDLTWPCYHAGRRLCGRCESCARFMRAVAAARATDWFAQNHPCMPLRKETAHE